MVTHKKENGTTGPGQRGGSPYWKNEKGDGEKRALRRAYVKKKGTSKWGQQKKKNCGPKMEEEKTNNERSLFKRENRGTKNALLKGGNTAKSSKKYGKNAGVYGEERKKTRIKTYKKTKVKSGRLQHNQGRKRDPCNFVGVTGGKRVKIPRENWEAAWVYERGWRTGEKLTRGERCHIRKGAIWCRHALNSNRGDFEGGDFAKSREKVLKTRYKEPGGGNRRPAKKPEGEQTLRKKEEEVYVDNSSRSRRKKERRPVGRTCKTNKRSLFFN